MFGFGTANHTEGNISQSQAMSHTTLTALSPPG